MTFLGVPWMTKNGLHDAEIGRALAYAASGGHEGVAGHADLRVTASSTPDGNVNVAAGAVSIFNRFAGGAAQSYVGMNDGALVQSITAQGAGSDRFDLIAVIVEDPQYPGQPDPTSVELGPYIRLAVYENVLEANRTLASVDAGQTGYVLAQVHVPASTSVITQSMITDLRELAVSKTHVVTRQLIVDTVAPISMPTVIAEFPTEASWEIAVPSWANRVSLQAVIPNVSMVDGGAGTGAGDGSIQVALGSVSSDLTPWYATAVAAGKTIPQTLAVHAELEVPAIERGTLQSLGVFAVQSTVSDLTAKLLDNATVAVTATFYEVPGVD